MLSSLNVRGNGVVEGYRRSLFPHWSIQSGTCNTREIVLARDGTGVIQDSFCRAVSGTWFSPYDNKTWYVADKVDIDHMVPLADAWHVSQCGVRHFWIRLLMSLHSSPVLQRGRRLNENSLRTM